MLHVECCAALARTSAVQRDGDVRAVLACLHAACRALGCQLAQAKIVPALVVASVVVGRQTEDIELERFVDHLHIVIYILHERALRFVEDSLEAWGADRDALAALLYVYLAALAQTGDVELRQLSRLYLQLLLCHYISSFRPVGSLAL